MSRPATAGEVKVGTYSHLAVAVISAALVVVISAASDSRVTTVEGLQIINAALQAFVVYVVSNHLGGRWHIAKAVAAGAVAVVQIGATYLVAPAHTPTPTEVINWVLTVLAAAGVYVTSRAVHQRYLASQPARSAVA